MEEQEREREKRESHPPTASIASYCAYAPKAKPIHGQVCFSERVLEATVTIPNVLNTVRQDPELSLCLSLAATSLQKLIVSMETSDEALELK